MPRKLLLFLPVFFATAFLSAAPDKSPKPTTLIIPGESIGDIKLGVPPAKTVHALGTPDYDEGIMGGKGLESWYLGTKHGDKGRIFHRPDEIGLTTLRDMDQDSAKTPGAIAITQIIITSPRYTTAEGIGPGSTLDAIRAKYPDIQPDRADYTNFWPFHGAMQFFKDKKNGIAFAIRQSDDTCIEVAVMPREGSGMKEYFTWGCPMASADYVIDDINGTVGEIKLGMTAAKLIALLGKPDEKRDESSGEMWRWRVPAQGRLELPALCIYLRKLPDGSLGAEQIRLSSPAFALTDKIFPGCTLNDALQATGNVVKLDSYPEQHLDFYGDLRAGILFDVRQAGSICTAITILPPPMDVHRNMGVHWLDLPPAPDGGD